MTHHNETVRGKNTSEIPDGYCVATLFEAAGEEEYALLELLEESWGTKREAKEADPPCKPLQLDDVKNLTTVLGAAHVLNELSPTLRSLEIAADLPIDAMREYHINIKIMRRQHEALMWSQQFDPYRKTRKAPVETPSKPVSPTDALLCILTVEQTTRARIEADRSNSLRELRSLMLVERRDVHIAMKYLNRKNREKNERGTPPSLQKPVTTILTEEGRNAIREKKQRDMFLREVRGMKDEEDRMRQRISNDSSRGLYYIRSEEREDRSFMVQLKVLPPMSRPTPYFARRIKCLVAHEDYQERHNSNPSARAPSWWDEEETKLQQQLHKMHNPFKEVVLLDLRKNKKRIC